MNILVSNLNQSLTEADLQRLFTPFGELRSVRVLRDKWNNRSTGKALIDMPVSGEAKKAIMNLHGSSLGGKTIAVKEASFEEEEGPAGSILS
jgi:RNA recognition motif-containing protein